MRSGFVVRTTAHRLVASPTPCGFVRPHSKEGPDVADAISPEPPIRARAGVSRAASCCCWWARSWRVPPRAGHRRPASRRRRRLLDRRIGREAGGYRARLSAPRAGVASPRARRPPGEVVVSDVVVDRDTGTTRVYLRQRFDGIEVAGGVINVSVPREGRGPSSPLGHRFSPGPRVGRMSSGGSLRQCRPGRRRPARGQSA